MAKKTSREAPKKGSTAADRNSSLLTIDEKIIVMHGNYGISPQHKFPGEFETLDKMAVNQSALFLSDKKKIIDALRNVFHKRTPKRFLIRKVDNAHSRIWRVKDNTITGYGRSKATREKFAKQNGSKKQHEQPQTVTQ